MRRFDLKNRKKAHSVAAAAVSSLAVAAVLMSTPGESSAYFTAYHTAQWEKALAVGSQTGITEEYDKDTGVKTVTIQNTGETECFVRVKIFSGSQVTLTISGENWSKGAYGYWYYGPALETGTGDGSKTKPLKITVKLPDVHAGGQEENAPVYDQNVVVVQECTQALYRDKADGPGQEAYADWTLSIPAETGEGAGS